MKQHRNLIITIVITLSTLIAISVVAHAEQDKLLGEFRDWIAVSFVENGNLNCYIVSQPKKEKGKYTQRGPAYVQVTLRHGAESAVVSFQAGYRFKETSEVHVQIDGDTQALFTQSEMAWAYPGEDKMLIDSMRQGKRMIVMGTSWRGTETTDTYSLYGFTKAYNELLHSCS
ncbi:MAG: hypothetical protein CFH37_00715 [Alphaproteobacteria bacterium MarineAlpha9_Bin7]|nr:MAG: hypothetical protein CFH37_00715 [Alphaproteobacteria bacterium MarineAlpha9_Bin7]